MDDQKTGRGPESGVEPLDLESCAREPIHIPGAIQPQGALLALDDDLVVEQASANAAEFLGVEAEALIGQPLDAALFGPGVRDRFAAAVAAGAIARVNPLSLRDSRHVGIAHRSPGGVLVLEIERDDGDEGSSTAEHSFLRLQSSTSLDQLLSAAAGEVSELLGFDRVMIYRFLPDASGEVVAEVCAEGLDPFLGLRYPASDIPAQARRLYTLNPIRVIADAAYAPVPVTPGHNPRTGGPLDMSYSVLRSVSPIHLEYLANMGVAASLSISLLVNGELWGLCACHHREPRPVGPRLRAKAQLLSRTLSLLVGQIEQQESAALRSRSAEVRATLTSRAKESGDVVQSLAVGSPDLLAYLDAGGAAVCSRAQIALLGETPPRSWVADLIKWLPNRGDRFVTDELAAHYLPAARHADTAAGLLALGFNPHQDGYVLFFRPEQVTTVRWGGDPRKPVGLGRHGARLTPRESFEEWKETVRGRSEPWRDGELEAARALQYELTALSLRWSAEQDRLRDIFVGMLGHDLRSPLAAITTAAELLGFDSSTKSASALSERIARSSRRMSRLISQLLDFNRIHSGSGISITPEKVDLAELVEHIVDEQSLAFPGCVYEVEIGERDRIDADPDRLEQVVDNLLANARDHGEPGAPVRVGVDRSEDGASARIWVHNRGEPIPPEARKTLFTPYGGAATDRSEGLGLGLYIADSIVRAHGGSIELDSSAAEGTEFRVLLPLAK